MSKENRVLPGVPTGGQFAPHARTDSDISLVADGRESEVAARRAAFDAAVNKTQQAYAATRPARAAFDNSVDLSPDYYVQLTKLQTAVDAWQSSLKEQERLGVLVTADNAPQPATNLDEAVEQTAQARAAARSSRTAFQNSTEGTDVYYRRLEVHGDATTALNQAIHVEQGFGGTGEDPSARGGPF